MKTLIVIPARYGSSRFEGKPLAYIKDPDGTKKTLIHRSWEAAKEVQGVDKIIVATDDTRISEHVHDFGGEAEITSREHKNGTERCAEIASKYPEYDIIVNLQGDAPLTPSWFVEALIESIRKHGSEVATPVLRCDEFALNSFIQDRKNDKVGGTTVTFSNLGRALYFSKEVIPYTGSKNHSDIPVFHHVGVYAYTQEALLKYKSLEEGKLEKLEGLEQLRFLENNIPVNCVEVNAHGRIFWELNNPDDIERIENILNGMV